MYTDEMIIGLMKARKEEGISAFQTEYNALVRYVVKPIINNYEDQEECIADVSIKVWERIDSFDGEKGSLKSWVSVIARNLAISKVRVLKETDNLDDYDYEVADAGPTPEEEILRKERIAEIRKVVDSLPMKEKELVYRKYFFMQPVAQIARELGMSERAVEGKLYRIKKKLGGLIGEKSYE